MWLAWGGLSDTRKSFRPTSFHYARWGCELSFFMTKLIHWEARWAELEASDNVFVLVVMAQIQAKRVKDDATRKDVKLPGAGREHNTCSGWQGAQ